MITNIQIKDLSKFYKIDEFTIIREYLQILILSYIYQEQKSEKMVFKGGTALRLMYGSPRFSEDLDFSTTLSYNEVNDFVLNLRNKTKKELPELKFKKVYQGKDGLRYNIKYEPKLFKFPLNLRLDFHIVKSIKNFDKSVLTTRFPVLVFPTIYHLSKKEILSEKLECIKTRVKGRDIFDIWYLLSTGEVISNKKYSQIYIKNIQKFDDNDLDRDLGKFLSLPQRTILPELKKTVLKYFVK